MNQFVDIGFGNMVNFDKVFTIVNPDSAPAKRMVQKAREEGKVIDGTQGRKTKSIMVLRENQVVLSALRPETLVGRYSGELSSKSKGAER